MTETIRRAHLRGDSELLLFLAPAGWGLAAIASVVLLGYCAINGDLAPMGFLAAVGGVCALLWFVPSPNRRSRRVVVTLFLLALAVRLGSVILFDSIGTRIGDPYAGSPDAWAYDQWARRLLDAWSELRDLNLHAYDAAGRWDVGFHYLLAVFYAIFGESVLAGRVLVAFFGAAAVVLLYLVARTLVGEKIAAVAGLVYAFWVSSIAWSGYSVLRDSLIWALTLLTVWLALRVASGSIPAVLGFFLALLSLRTVRPYAATCVVIGLAVAGALALFRRWRRVNRGLARSRAPRQTPVVAVRPAFLFALAVVATEAVFFLTGFPSVAGMVVAYRPKGVFLKSLPTVHVARPAPRYPGLHYRGASPRDAEEDDSEDRMKLSSKRLFGPSLPANTLRFFLSPPAWAPVRGDIRVSDNWQLPGMWLWYLILPVAAVGFLAALRAKNLALRALVATSALFIGLLILVGRGDLSRQREMVVPIVLLCFALGLPPALRRRRLLLRAYLVYALILAAGILYHRHTLRARGMAAWPESGPCRTAAPAREIPG